MITANYTCEDREYTVEVIDTDGEDVTIACDVFPLVFVRHVGWCKQPTMTVNKKWIYNIRDTEAQDPRIVRRENLLSWLRDEPCTADEAHQIFEELAEIDQSLQIHPSDSLQDRIAAGWNHIQETQI